MIKDRKPLTHERAGRILAGSSALVVTLLAWIWSPWWLLAVGGIGVNLLVSGLTNRCIVKHMLIRLGLPGERDVGRSEAMLSDAGREPMAFRRVISRPRVTVN